MAIEDKTVTLTVQQQVVGADATQAALENTGRAVDGLTPKYQALYDRLAALSGNFDGISTKLGQTSQAASAAAAAFDAMGMDPASASAAQLSGRISEVASGFDALVQVTDLAAQSLGTHTSAVNQAIERYDALSSAQDDVANSSGLSTAAWVAAGVAGVALVGVTAGLVVGVIAAKDALLAAADATGHWAWEMATGGILDNMQQLVATGHELNDLSTTTGVAAQNFSILATGLQGSGMSADTTKGLLTGLQKTLVDTGTEAADARIRMRDMGIDLETVGKNGNDAQAVFLALADRLSQYQDGAEKTALAEKLLGSSSAEVINGIDGANAAYARMDTQTRTNIANTAAYTAALQDQIAKFKDLRDNQPATLAQSQISGGMAQIGGGWERFKAGFDGGSGLFSQSGRDMMGAGLSDAARGTTEIAATVAGGVESFLATAMGKIDAAIGTQLAKPFAAAAQGYAGLAGANAPNAGQDLRSAPPVPAYGSYEWAISAGTSFAAQYDSGTAALQTFTVAYARVIDAMQTGLITEDQATAAIGKLAQAYGDAIGPFDKMIAQQQQALALRQQNVPGPQRDAAQLRQQLIDAAVGQNQGAPATPEQLSRINGIVSGTTAQNTADQSYQQTQAQTKALADLHTQQLQAVADAGNLAAAWGGSSAAGLQMEAQIKALTAVRAIDKDATVGQADIVRQLTLSYDQAYVQGAQYLDQLRQQAAAAEAAANAGADPQAQAQAAITAQVQQQYQSELAKSILVAQETGDLTAYLAVMQQISDATQLLADIHASQMKKALEDEVAATADQLQMDQQSLDVGTKNSAEYKVQQAVIAETNKLRKEGYDIEHDALAQQAIANTAQDAAIKAQADAEQKLADQQAKDIKKTADDITRTMSTDFYDMLQGKNVSVWQSFKDLAFKAIADIAAKMLETQFILPIVTEVMGGSGGGSSGAAGTSGGFGGSSLLSLGSTASSVSGMFGGPTISSTLGNIYSGSALESGVNGAGAYLFGTAGNAGMTTAGTGLTVGDTVAGETLTSADFASEGSSGLISSGGTGAAMSGAGSAVGAAGASYMAGSYTGQAIGSPGYGAAAGAAEGAIIGTMVWPIIGTIIGAIAGAIGGALGGQHPTVGPNATSSLISWDPTTQSAQWHDTADNGGNTGASGSLMAASVNALTTTVKTLGGTINNVSPDSVGYFKGKYFVSDQAAGGSATYENNQFADGQSAINDFLIRELKSADISGLSSDVKTAIGTLNDSMSATDISNVLAFASEFQDSLKSLTSGLTDYTKSAQLAADATAQNLVTQIQSFRDNTTKAGLSLDDANAALKAYATNMLDPPKTQSALQVSIDQTTAQFNSMQSVLVNVGYSAADAASLIQTKLKAALDQIKQTYTSSAAAQINTAQGNDFLNQIQTIFTNLPANIADSVAATGSGAMAQNVANAQIDQILEGLSPDQISAAVSQFGDASKVGADAAKNFLSLADGVAASKAAAQQATTSLKTANDNLNFFTNSAKSLGDYALSLATSSNSPLSPLDQYNSARAQFEGDQALAKGGNQDAISRLQTDAQAFLTASKAYNATNAQYGADFAEVQKAITADAAYAASQVAVEQKIVDSLNGNVLTQLQAIEKAINAQNAKNGGTGSFNGVANAAAAAGGGPINGYIPTGGWGGIMSSAGVTTYNGAASGPGWNAAHILSGTATAEESIAYLQAAGFAVSMSDIPGHAVGGVASGWSMVGEKGPELAYFGQPATIYPNGQTQAMLSGSNDNSAAAEIRQLRAQVEQLTKVVATAGVQTVGAVQQGNQHLKRMTGTASRNGADPQVRRA